MNITQPGHWDILAGKLIGLKALQLNSPVWLIGDSQTEQLVWSSLAGVPVLNIGFASIRLQSLVPYLRSLLPTLPPPRGVAIMLSINNACLPNTDPEQVTFNADYSGLISLLKGITSSVGLMTIAPFECGYGYDPQMPALISQLSYVNNAIAANAAYYNLPIYDVNARTRGADLTALPGTTVDGVHFSREGAVSVEVLYAQFAGSLT